MYLYMHVPMFLYMCTYMYIHVSMHLQIYFFVHIWFLFADILGPWPQALQGHVDKKNSELMALNQENNEQAKLGQRDLVLKTWQW